MTHEEIRRCTDTPSTYTGVQRTVHGDEDSSETYQSLNPSSPEEFTKTTSLCHPDCSTQLDQPVEIAMEDLVRGCDQVQIAWNHHPAPSTRSAQSELDPELLQLLRLVTMVVDRLKEKKEGDMGDNL